MIGHGDWYAGNLRFSGDQLIVAHDWDSVITESEAVLVGFAAALYPVLSVGDEPTVAGDGGLHRRLRPRAWQGVRRRAARTLLGGRRLDASLRLEEATRGERARPLAHGARGTGAPSPCRHQMKASRPASLQPAGRRRREEASPFGVASGDGPAPPSSRWRRMEGAGLGLLRTLHPASSP